GADRARWCGPLGQASSFQPEDQIRRSGGGIDPPADGMLARGEKIAYLHDDCIGIIFRECGHPDQIAYRMGSLGCGMGTNARKIEHFPTSRHLWKRKDTGFQGKADGFLAGCHGLSPYKLLVVFLGAFGSLDIHGSWGIMHTVSGSREAAGRSFSVAHARHRAPLLL